MFKRDHHNILVYFGNLLGSQSVDSYPAILQTYIIYVESVDYTVFIWTYADTHSELQLVYTHTSDINHCKLPINRKCSLLWLYGGGVRYHK